MLALCSYYLYLDFHKRPEERGAEKQGYITFKYRVAQRKFPSRMIWEDVEQMLPIYNKDSIRTDFLSEAIVTLNNGIKIELDPDSMIVLNILEKQVNVSLEKGALSVSTTKSLTQPNEFSLNHKDIKLSFQDNNGQFKILENSPDVEIVSTQGSITLETKTKKESIFPKQKANINTEMDTLDKADLKDFEMLPAHNTRYFIEENSKEILFLWNEKQNQETQISISKDKSLKIDTFTAKTKENKFAKEFSEGIYYWKIKSSLGEESDTRKFRIIKNPPLKLIAPTNNKELKTKSGESIIAFNWSKRELALSYHFEISNDETFKNVLISKNVFRNDISIPLSLGKYYWRVRAFDSMQGAKSNSEVFSFNIEKEPIIEKSTVDTIQDNEEEPIEEIKPAKEAKNDSPEKKDPLKIKDNPPNKVANPVLLFPRPNSTVDMNKMDSIPFKWQTVAGAKSYLIKFIQSSNGEVIFQTETTSPNFNFTQLEKLDVGSFTWTVEAIPGLETAEKGSSSARFNITLGDQPAAPETISKGKKEE